MSPLSFVWSVLFACGGFAAAPGSPAWSAPPEPPAPPEPAAIQDPVPPAPTPEQQALARIRAAFTGSFLGVERKDGREGQGHILAVGLPGGFIGRDYWSEGGGRRLYAGHDVLEFELDGSVRHWWFGSRGDEAYAEGVWSEEQVVLHVLDDDGDRLRRYTYSLGREEAPAFHFQNDHADGEDWEFFMDADWRRGELRLPFDFQPDPDEVEDTWRAHFVGAWQAPAGRHRGRFLFEEWLVLDGPAEHTVIASGWFGKLRLWTWLADGTVQEYEGKRRGEELRLRRRGEEEEEPSWVFELGSPGFRSTRDGRLWDFSRSK